MRIPLKMAVIWAELALLPVPVSAADDAKCYADWSAAAPVVAREKLFPTQELHRQVSARHLGEPIRITLCEESGRFVYRVVVQGRHGKVQNLTLDARKPF